MQYPGEDKCLMQKISACTFICQEVTRTGDREGTFSVYELTRHQLLLI